MNDVMLTLHSLPFLTYWLLTPGFLFCTPSVVSSVVLLSFIISCQCRVLRGLTSLFLIINCCQFYFFSPFCMQDCILGPCLSFCWPSVFPFLNSRNWEQETVEPVLSSLMQKATTILSTNHNRLIIAVYDHTWHTVEFS